MKTVPMKPVTRVQYFAFLNLFPDRFSYRVTGEPPQEHCVRDGVLIGRITLREPLETNTYEVADMVVAVTPTGDAC